MARHATADPPARRPGSRSLRPVDGLRGAAVAAILAYHLGWLRGGFLGVDLFFVVSGFLVTRALIERRDSGQVLTIGWFWRRWLVRMMPVLLVLCAAVVIWTLRLPGGPAHRPTLGEAGTALIFGNNWYDLYGNVGALDVASTATPLVQLWPVSILGQFCLVWAALFVALGRRTARLGWLAVLVGIVALASAALQPWYFLHQGYARSYLGTDSRLDAILIGVLIALFLTRPLRLGWQLGLRGAANSQSLGIIALTGLVAGCVEAHLTAGWLYRGGLVALSVAAGVLLFAVLADPSGWLSKLFGLPPLAGLGRVSYSLYLWHLPIIVIVTARSTHLAGAGLVALRVVLIVAATAASYFLIEAPIRRGVSIRHVRIALIATAVFLLAAFDAPRTLAGFGPSSASNSAPATLAGALPDPAVLTGAAASRLVIQANQIIDGVPGLTANPAYPSIVSGLRSAKASAAYSTDDGMAAASLTYAADADANAVAITLQDAVLKAGGTLRQDSANLKYLMITGGGIPCTIGFLRGTQSLSVVAIVGTPFAAELVRARSALRFIGTARGVALP